MNNINKELDKTKDILKKNIDSLLHRGEALESLVKKSEELKDFSSIFKKRARQIRESEENSLPKISKRKPSLKNTDTDTDIIESDSDDYTSSIEDTDIKDYEEQLRQYYYQGEYQYVLDKASQLGLTEIVKKLLHISEYVPMKLELSSALLTSSHYGHLEVIEVLLDNDIENERYFGREARLETESILPIFGRQYRIPYTNIPLTHDNLRNAILASYTANHSELAKILESYYYRTNAIKDRHDINKVNEYF